MDRRGDRDGRLRVALVNSPVNQPLLWIGTIVALLALPVFLVLAKMGFNPSDH